MLLNQYKLLEAFNTSCIPDCLLADSALLVFFALSTSSNLTFFLLCTIKEKEMFLLEKQNYKKHMRCC